MRNWMARRLALLSVAFAVLAGLLDKETVAFLCSYWEEVDNGMEEALRKQAQIDQIEKIVAEHRRIRRRSAEKWPTWHE